MYRHPCSTTEAISNYIMYCHICCKTTSIIDVACLTIRRVCTAHIVVVSSHHDCSLQPTVTNSLLESLCDTYTSQRVCIQDACLRAPNQPYFILVLTPLEVLDS